MPPAWGRGGTRAAHGHLEVARRTERSTVGRASPPPPEATRMIWPYPPGSSGSLARTLRTARTRGVTLTYRPPSGLATHPAHVRAPLGHLLDLCIPELPPAHPTLAQDSSTSTSPERTTSHAGPIGSREGVGTGYP